MELLMINESKLKIMMTKEDLAEFELRAEELDYCNTETKRMLWDLLNRAKHTVGFDTDGYRVLVQLYPSRTGGCELFVTKIASVFCDCEEEGDPLIEGLPRLAPREERKPRVFGFDELERMLTVCRRLIEGGYGRFSQAYIGDDRRYYLFLDGLDAAGYLPLDEYSFILEYGTVENAEATRGFLCEHGKPICEEGAVERLGVL
ncbi:MAG: adaptor protein MecA [Clostridia bacterium]|nr:adaptor protein MecA [Clostridia bacterium]